MITHIKNWNKWRKYSLNSKFYKLLVLFKITRSPTFKAVSYFTKYNVRYEIFKNKTKSIKYKE